MIAPRGSLAQRHYKRPNGEDFYVVGQAAYAAGYLSAACPFDPRSEAAGLWSSGYADAQDDLEEARQCRARTARDAARLT